ncbi:Cell division cycle protein 20 [Blattella germanica]|nr:Cell division cycle protein 20 [Blattella germanica]
MSQFAFANELKNCLKMDEPITKGPIPRWQKKRLESSNSSNATLNNSKLKLPTSCNTSLSKTPSKRNIAGETIATRKTPGKTPTKSPSSKTTTPGKATKTPNGGDRFIPVRNTSNFELGHYMAHLNPLRVVYSLSKTPGASKNSTRYVPQTPDRILDAPDIIDDYFALNTNVYLWNATSGNIQQLLSLEGNDYVSSVSWIEEGSHLAVGTSCGVTQLWDCTAMKKTRSMGGHSARVGSLAWNNYILTSGSRSGQIIHNDVRARSHVVSELTSHTQEVCALQWSTTYKEFISGHGYANNQLIIWKYPSMTKVTELTGHTARVLHLALSPDGTTVLSAGADETLRLWKCFMPDPAKKKKETTDTQPTSSLSLKSLR